MVHGEWVWQSSEKKLGWNISRFKPIHNKLWSKFDSWDNWSFLVAISSWFSYLILVRVVSVEMVRRQRNREEGPVQDRATERLGQHHAYSPTLVRGLSIFTLGGDSPAAPNTHLFFYLWWDGGICYFIGQQWGVRKNRMC